MKSPASAIRVKTVSITVKGKTVKRPVLVTSSGRPVYMLTGDSATHPKCTGASCMAVWPPATTKATRVTAAKGVSGKLTVWHHMKINQLVFNGHPLYMFASDSAGRAAGDGIKSFGGTWWVLSKSGTPVSVSKHGGGGGGGGGTGYGGGSSWG